MKGPTPIQFEGKRLSGSKPGCALQAGYKRSGLRINDHSALRHKDSHTFRHTEIEQVDLSGVQVLRDLQLVALLFWGLKLIFVAQAAVLQRDNAQRPIPFDWHK